MTAIILRRQPYYRSISAYWDSQYRNRDKAGSLAPWANDFVSIHEHDGLFSLIGPLFIPMSRSGNRRPQFEDKQFGSFAQAKRYALRFARRVSKVHRVHVVNCCVKVAK